MNKKIFDNFNLFINKKMSKLFDQISNQIRLMNYNRSKTLYDQKMFLNEISEPSNEKAPTIDPNNVNLTPSSEKKNPCIIKINNECITIEQANKFREWVNNNNNKTVTSKVIDWKNVWGPRPDLEDAEYIFLNNIDLKDAWEKYGDEFLIEYNKDLNPKNDTEELIFIEENEKWSGLTNQQKVEEIRSTIKLVNDKIKQKVTSRLSDLMSNIKLKLKLNNFNFVLTSSNTSKDLMAGNEDVLSDSLFSYDFGTHTRKLTSQVGEPTVIDFSGEGPYLPDKNKKQILLGSSLLNNVSIGQEILNELERWEKFKFMDIPIVRASDGKKYTMYHLILFFKFPVSITPYSTEDIMGVGNLYFDDSQRICYDNYKSSKDKLIELNKDFDASMLFNTDERPTKENFVCLVHGKSPYGNERIFKITNNNLIITTPNLDNYLDNLMDAFRK